MSIISGVTVNWAASPRIITIPSPIVEVTIEDLNDTLQDIEDNEEGIAFPKLRDASGKEDLGGGVLVGLTVKLINAKVKFADRSAPWIICNVKDGNLLAVDANNVAMSPIEPSSYVTVTKTSSTSAALIGGAGGGWDDLVEDYQTVGSFGKLVKVIEKRVNKIFSVGEQLEG